MDSKRRLITAYLWTITSKFFMRGLGVISTLILVRLLDPSEFGLIAVATAILGFFFILSGVEINRYLVLLDEVSNDDYNSAWTYSILLKVLAIGGLIAFAGMIEQYLAFENLQQVIIWVSLTAIIGVFNNIGLVKLAREMDFSVESKLDMISKIASVIACVTAAFYFRNYYCLVIGALVNALVKLIGSYLLCNYRPKLNFSFNRKMIFSSTRYFLRNIISFSRSKLDYLLVGRLFGDTGVGRYDIAQQFAIMPQSELITPAAMPIFSSLAAYKHQPDHQATKTFQILFLGHLLIFPCIFGLNWLNEAFVTVVFGDKWLNLTEYIGILSLLMLPYFLQGIMNNLYDSRNMTMTSIIIDGLSIVLLLLAFYQLNIDSIAAFSIIRVVIAGIVVVISIVIAKWKLDISLWNFIYAFGFPFVFSLIMYMILQGLNLRFESNFLELMINTCIGAMVYIIELVIFYYITTYKWKRGRLYRFTPQIAALDGLLNKVDFWWLNFIQNKQIKR